MQLTKPDPNGMRPSLTRMACEAERREVSVQTVKLTECGEAASLDGRHPARLSLCQASPRVRSVMNQQKEGADENKHMCRQFA